ncbi:dihydroxyacetone kinase phosphoryl donor subunit DhaM [Streptomyces sp. NPDC049585]|uniref:dihydroxyacetone kinase phosphoryl donor subunit DhaM n=1 Tax=Streptomyces sp. NPDC049585 TaxID=3155154 RepID=UPI00343E9BF9
MTALYEATDPELCATAPQPRAQDAAEPAQQRAGRVGVVLVSHSRAVAESTAALARALAGGGVPARVAPAGGLPDGTVGTSAELVRRATADADEGVGVVVLCDMGSAVLTVKSLLENKELQGVHIADAPFVEGAVAAVVTASAGGDLDAVLAAADDARAYRKL